MAKVYLHKLQFLKIYIGYLLVSEQVVFKTALMVWKCVHGVAPAYLCDLYVPATTISGHQHLRSAAIGTLLVPHDRTATGLRSPDLSESAFKRALKKHLFSPSGTIETYLRRHWETEHLPSPDRVSGTAFLLPSVIRHCRRQSSESC